MLSATLAVAIFLSAAATFAGQWTEVPGGAPNFSTLHGVAVISSNDAWAVGGLGNNGSHTLIEHWDGTSWSVAAVPQLGGNLLGVAARTSDDVLAVGQSEAAGQVHSLIVRWNGNRWIVLPSPNVGTYDVLYGVYIVTRNDAWAVGYSLLPDYVYTLMHWDGTSWSLVNGPPANSSALLSVKAFRRHDKTDEVWAVGYKDFNGSTASTFTLHYDGTTWSEVPSPNVDDQNYLASVDGANPSDMWAVGDSGEGVSVSHYLALHWDGAVWSVVPTPMDNGNSQFYGLTVLSSANIIAVGESDGVPSSAHWDGTQWRVVPTPPVTNNSGFLWAISSHDQSVWAVGQQGFGVGEPDDLLLTWIR